MSYLESEQWNIIRKVILRRDVGMCRGCGAKTENVIFLCADDDTLIGKRPDYLLTFCLECVAKVRNKKDERTLQNKILEEVLCCPVKKGVSNPRIGRWYANAYQMNLSVAEEIKDELASYQLCEIK
jgi:hypothetical protein